MNFIRKPKKKGKKGSEPRKDFYSDTCDIHHGKEVWFCSDCDYIYCISCSVTGHHNQPHQLKTIDSVSEAFKRSEEFEDYMKKISTLKKESDLSIENIEENIILVNNYKDEADRIINQHCNDLINLIRAHVNECLDRSKKERDDCVSSLEASSKQICELKEHLEQIENEINTKQEKCDSNSMFITVQKSKQNVIRIEEQIGLINENKSVTRYEFRAGEQLLNYMKNVDAFGVFVEMSSKPKTMSHSVSKSDPCLMGSLEEKKELDEDYLEPGRAESNLSLNETQQFHNSEEHYAETGIGDAEKYKVLYTYIAEEEDQLNINEGDIVYVFGRCNDEEWLFAELNGHSGYIPAIYVEKYVIKKPPKTAPKPSLKTVTMARERKPWSYFSQQSSEPQLLKPERPKPAPRPSVVTIEQTKKEQTQDSVKYIVLHTYTARSDGELSIKEGDIVNVDEKYDGEYWRWAERNGQSGYVPAIHVGKYFRPVQQDIIKGELEKKFMDKFGTH